MLKKFVYVFFLLFALQMVAFAQSTVPSAPVLTSPSNNLLTASQVYSFQWKSVSNATFYQVQISRDSSFGTVDFDTTISAYYLNITYPSKLNLTSYHGTPLYWHVRATNSNGSGLWSERWNYTFFPQVKLVFPSNNTSSVPLTPTLLWRKIGGASTYRVQVSTDSTFIIAGRMITDDSLAIDTSKALGSLSAHGDSVIYWRVKAKNTVGINNSWSQLWAFSTGTVPVPNAPALSFPNNNTVTDGVKSLSWRSSSYANDFRIQLSTDSSFGIFILDSTLTETYLNIPQNLNDAYRGITLYWRVQSINPSGSSSWSSRWNYTVFPTVTLSSPLNNALGVSSTPTLLWRKNNGTSTYRVQVSTDSTFTIVGRIITDDSLLIDTSKTLSSLSAYGDSVIFWRVRAKSTSGINNNWSQRWTFSTSAAPVPASPVLSYPSKDSVLQNATMSLSWKTSNNATSYKVQVSTDSSFGSASFDSTVTGTSFSSSSFSNWQNQNPGITIYWRVQAKNLSGSSPWSNRWNYTVFPTVTQVSPQNNALGVSSTPTLLWRKINSTSTYRVQVSTDSTFTIAGRIITDDSLLIDTSRTLGSLSAHGDSLIFWRVKARNAAGVNNSWSQRWAFSTGVLPVPTAPVLSYPNNDYVTQGTVMSVSWNTSTYATSYKVQISTDSGFGSTILDSNLNGTYISLMLLLNAPNYQGTTLYWHVRASNSSGNSPWSTRWNFTTFPIVNHLSPLDNASSVSLTPTLFWRKIGGASTYRMQVSTDSTFTIAGRIITDDSLLTDTSKTLSSLSAYGDSVIFWRVKAKNASGVRNEWSQRWAFSTGALPVPTAPVLSYPNNDYVTQGTVMSVSWNTSTYATSYKVQISTDSGFGSTILDSNLNGTYISLMLLLNAPNYQGTTLYWHVRASNSSGNSPWSTRWNFTTFPIVNHLSPLNNASSVSLTPTLLWRKISGASTYRIQVSTDSTFTITGRIITDDSLVIDTSRTLNSLSTYGDSVIFWRVKAKNASGVRNEWSQQWAFSTGALPVPAAPVLSYPNNGLVTQSTIMSLNWSASTYTTTYKVQVSTDSGFGSTILDSTFNGTYISVMFLLNTPNYQGITLYWHVRASNSSGNSPWSARWSFTTFPKVNHLSPLNNAFGVSLTPTLLWLKISGASTYRVQASTDSTFTIAGRMIADDSLLVDTSKALGSLSAHGDSLIFWRVRATNATGVRNDWSQQWAFTTGSLPGILVDDFEGGFEGNKIGTYWYFWSDSSSIIRNAGPQNKFTGGYTPGNASTYSGIMNFTVKSGSSYTEVGMGTNLDNAEGPVDLTGATAVQFDIKTSRPMNVKFQVPQSTITDFSYYEANINAGTSWMTITVNLSIGASGLSKPARGSYVPFAINKVKQLHWLYRANENMGIDSSGTISIDNIKIIGNPVGLKAPFPPLLKSPGYKSTGNSVSPTMVWHPSTGATSYCIQISTSDSMNSFIVNQSNITDTTYIVSGLSNNTKYYWRVNASNGSVTTRWSGISWFSTIGQSDVIIKAGWNMISLNINPTNSSCQAVFDSLRGFVLAKNDSGKIYYPAYALTDFDSLIPGHGYKVYSDSLDTLRVTGSPIDVATTPISLSTGWNMTAFLPQSNMPIVTALAGIVSQLLLVKNNLGEIYMPDYSINTIGDMQVGQGYKMYMKNADTLTYPSSSSSSLLSKAKIYKSPLPGHFLCKGVTGSNTTMLAEQVTIDHASVADNSEIGAFDEKGIPVGSGVIMKGKAVFCIWGDNPQTKEKDGCIAGEKISFKLWDGVQEYQLEQAETDMINYQDEAILTGKFSVPLKFLIKNFALKAISPNPVRNRLTLLFDVPVINGKEAQEVTINIFGLNGRLIHQLIKGKYAAGHYSVTWDIGKESTSASNMFIVRMKSATFDKKLMMFRAK